MTLLVLDLPGTGPLRPVRNALGTMFSPLRSAGNAVFEPFSNGWKGAFGYEEISQENDRMKAELDERKSERGEIARLEAEVDQLEKIVGVDAGDVQTITAQVVAVPVSNFDPTVEIDRGSDDGVKKGMAIITGLTKGTGGGLLGRVTEVRGGSATVAVVTTATFEVGVRLVTGELAVLKGQGRDKPLLAEGIPATVKLEPGDWIYTSGVEGSQFPGDLKIGRVTKVQSSGNGLSQAAEVEPLADLSGAYVKVALKDPPK
ncbi:MAG: rod shape-determining protein MreC [Aquihabitans sp.]